MTEAIPKRYKPWIIVSLVILVGSLILLAVAVIAGFGLFGKRDAVPVWLIVLVVVAVLGIALGFAGFFLMLVTASYTAWRESRRVQVLPPDPAP